MSFLGPKTPSVPESPQPVEHHSAPNLAKHDMTLARPEGIPPKIKSAHWHTHLYGLVELAPESREPELSQYIMGKFADGERHLFKLESKTINSAGQKGFTLDITVLPGAVPQKLIVDPRGNPIDLFSKTVLKWRLAKANEIASAHRPAAPTGPHRPEPPVPRLKAYDFMDSAPFSPKPA